jgi:hypothetical protein
LHHSFTPTQRWKEDYRISDICHVYTAKYTILKSAPAQITFLAPT